MANNDGPKGFQWVKTTGSNAPIVDYTVLAGTVAKGDWLVFSAGTTTIALSNSGLLHGLAGEAGVSGETILFYPAVPQNVFEGQTSGSYATASHLNALVDIEGATGAQEVNEDANTEKVLQIIGLKPGSETGANAKVYVTVARSSYQGFEVAL